jgi:Zn-dependent protease with chaperone function/tetratricopeptide (TPR) repeat protein
VGAATAVLLITAAIIAGLIVVAGVSTMLLRRAGRDRDRLVAAASTALTTATAFATVTFIASAFAVHLAAMAYGPRVGGGIRTVIWLVCVIGLVRLVRAILTRPETEAPVVLDGVRLEPHDAPRLFAVIDDVAAQLGVPRPDHVVAAIDGGCFVGAGPFVCGGEHLYGVTLHLTIPWCRSLSPNELRSVIAHELAHVEAGDLDWSAPFASVLDRAARVHAALVSPPASSVVAAFGLALARTLDPVRQAQELRADRTAVRLAGAPAAASAMIKVARACGLPAEAESERVSAIGVDPKAAAVDAARALEAGAWTLADDAPDLERRAREAAAAGRPAPPPPKRWYQPDIPLAELGPAVAVLAVAGLGAWFSPRRPAPRPAPPAVRVVPTRGAEALPDTIALLDELRAGRVEAVEAGLADAVRRARTSPLDELVSETAFRAFDVADRQIEPRLDEWVARRPGSAVAVLARARYRSGRAWEARGGAYRVSAAQRAEMHRLFALATSDARAALRLDPDLVEADIALLQMAPVIGDCDAVAAAGLAKRPASYRLRSLYLHCLLPRWHGSYRDMRAFALATLRRADANPRLVALGGLLDWDAGRRASEGGDDDLALAYYARALAYGPEARAFEARAIANSRREDYPHALDDLDAALHLRPDDADLVRHRAFVLATMGRLEDAAEAVRRAEHLDPDLAGLARVRRFVAHRLVVEGDARLQRGDDARALQLLQPVLLLEPNNQAACARVAHLMQRSGRGVEADAVSRDCGAVPRAGP